MSGEELLPHLFRTEYHKIVSVLCKRFGFDHIEIAQDIASDTFLTATQSWGLSGTPQDPVAWLYTAAKNKALNYIQRKGIFEQKVSPEIISTTLPYYYEEIDLSEHNIKDSQLQMMFAVCHPLLSPEAQIGLALRILCGFGIEEIASAFLTGKETVNKRLCRAKEKLREANIPIEFPNQSEISERLTHVLRTIYLLFNEGYYSSSNNKILRKDLCLEAIRLCAMLIENETTNQPEVNALLSLMCFHASRFDARTNDSEELILYDKQDPSRWNEDLIAKGMHFLNRSAKGDTLTKYHLEAGIAYWHTQKTDTPEKWENILRLYDHLLQCEYSPITALNRAYALSKVKGRQEAIAQAESLQLVNNRLYFSLLGELYKDLDNNKALDYFRKALQLAQSDADKLAIQGTMDSITRRP